MPKQTLEGVISQEINKWSCSPPGTVVPITSLTFAVLKWIEGTRPPEKCFFKRDLPLSRYREAKLKEEGYNQALADWSKALGLEPKKEV